MILVLFLACATAPESTPAPAPEAQKADQADAIAQAPTAGDNDLRDLVRFLNATCGSGKCSSENEFHFYSIACDAGTCTVTFAATTADGESHDGKVTVPAVADPVDAAGNADKHFVAAIGAAVAEWESKTIPAAPKAP